MSNGLTFMLNYTFSKELDDLAGNRYPGENYLEYSVGALDRKHVLTSTVVYRLPFGGGRKYNPSNSVARAIVSDWQVSGVFTAATAAPLSVAGTCNGGGIIDALLLPEPHSGVQWPCHAAEQAAYEGRCRTRASECGGVYKPGGLHLRKRSPHGSIRTSSHRTPRTSMPAFGARFRSLRKRVRLSVQADVFNLPNRPYFTAPNTTLSSTSYGTFTSQANQSRKWQFSARITF